MKSFLYACVLVAQAFAMPSFVNFALNDVVRNAVPSFPTKGTFTYVVEVKGGKPQYNKMAFDIAAGSAKNVIQNAGTTALALTNKEASYSYFSKDGKIVCYKSPITPTASQDEPKYVKTQFFNGVLADMYVANGAEFYFDATNKHYTGQVSKANGVKVTMRITEYSEEVDEAEFNIPEHVECAAPPSATTLFDFFPHF